MVIRRIQLKNNLYLNRRHNKDDAHSKALGDYCVFGYFDAMSIDKKDWGESGIWQVLSEGIIKEIDGSCSVRSLLCVSEDEEKDNNFWMADTSESFSPLLFVSIIRLEETMEFNDVTGKMGELNSSEFCMAYFSYEHSELIVFFKTNRYSDGHAFCDGLHKMFRVYKMYTLFSVKENVLESYNIKKEIIEEKVDCRLRAIVKNWFKIQGFQEKLEEALGKEKGSLLVRHMMGNSDVLFEISGISIQKLLACYKTNKILTHSNQDYQEAFYNVETEILRAEEYNGG